MGKLRFKFNPEKTGQAAAYLLKRAGGTLQKGKLVKMLYASDWSQLRTVGAPITGDQPVSMPHGPVLSGVLDFLNGKRTHAFWDKHISKAESVTHRVRLVDPEAPTDLLSEREMRALDRVYDFFGPLDWPKVKSECYRIFKEWKNPEGSQNPIDFEDMLTKSGKRSAEYVAELTSIQAANEKLNQLLA